jgi:hypothetical protein
MYVLKGNVIWGVYMYMNKGEEGGKGKNGTIMKKLQGKE